VTAPGCEREGEQHLDGGEAAGNLDRGVGATMKKPSKAKTERRRTKDLSPRKGPAVRGGGTLLPAVQAARQAARSGSDAFPTERISMVYGKI
jgi:hypothetical protein